MIGTVRLHQKGLGQRQRPHRRLRDFPWEQKQIEPQYLLSLKTWQEEVLLAYLKEVAKNYGKDEL
jgi:hypothetical protein